jgi:hypothetical protein
MPTIVVWSGKLLRERAVYIERKRAKEREKGQGLIF